MLGNVRVLAFCFDGKQRVCHIRGSLRKVWINTGDIILVGLSDYQDDEGDVFLKYTPDCESFETEENELPEHTKINENDEQEEGEIEFSYLGAESEDDEGEEEDNNMPSSESDESEGESEKCVVASNSTFPLFDSVLL
ncbi:hypothetical protein Q1695_012666 [Nippostrongylus brasiliensis]|nr:hypothetical protein Q1695_012666 [Nippostrongylus brasiliensis]